MENEKTELSQEINLNIDLEKRKKKLLGFFKEKKEWIFYLLLSFLVGLSIFIRTRNISKLKDITTGTWTLGPDLDPFLFLRWAKYIAEHGKLYILDPMRSAPLIHICSGSTCDSINTGGEMKLISYMIVWLHKAVAFITGQADVTYSAIIFPVVMFALTVIAFFLFARKIFYKEDKKTRNIIALISTAFFLLVPSLLPRTIAGIPEKESVAFLFIFLAFYFFLEAFTSEKIKKGLIFGILAGISTGILALTWGGVVFVFITITGVVLFAFILGKVNEKRFYFFTSWIAAAVLLMIPFSTRYTLQSLLTSMSTSITFVVFFVLLIDFFIFKKKIFNIHEKIKIKLPPQIISLIFAGILVIILASLIFGLSFFPEIIKEMIQHTVHPMSDDRFTVTVAENKQPYFIDDWRNDFGPVWFNIPLYFWLFFFGSVLLFYNLIKFMRKKEKIALTISYSLFLIGLVFSRYSASSILNGSSGLSLVVYFGSVLLFLGTFGYFYYKRYKEGEFEIFDKFELSYVLYFIILTMTIMAARGAVRLIMVLGAISPIAVGFLAFKFPSNYIKEKEDTKKLLFGIIAVLIIVASLITLWNYYNQDKNMAESFAPGAYQYQWQKAMQWVRDNTSENAVFAHWWDYGYWIQSIGERATVLDGGNAIGYWNHLMGRNVLTGPDERAALEFLYAHNVTHLLIDSTDIGKYAAFSSIGSNGNYDRFSWISTFGLDESQTQETNNETISVYTGGTPVDEDIIWNESGKEILLPRKMAAVGAVILKESLQNGKKFLKQPEAIFIYKSAQYRIPLRYMYVEGELKDFKSGIDAGIFFYPLIKQDANSGGISVNPLGVLLYLSKRTINSRLAQLYLFNQESDYFKLAHTEDELVIQDLKKQGMNIGDFMEYNGFRGPIKIWEVTYPKDIKLKQEYLNMTFPSTEYQSVRSEEYSN